MKHLFNAITKLTLLTSFLVITSLALTTSCEKETLQPTKTVTQSNMSSTSSSRMEDCLKHNQRIINNIIDSITQHGNWRKSLAYFYHIKTRDSLSAIYNLKIAETRVYESPQVFIEPSTWEDAKFDMLDSMNLVWKSKELIINSETQQSIDKEINRMRQSGEIIKCEEDTYDPNTGKS